jgi:hypothetical protein
MFVARPCIYPEFPFLSQSIEESVLLDVPLTYFDREGYELAALEQVLYRREGIVLCDILNHVSAGEVWFEGRLDKVHLDHSAIFTRYSYVRALREQLDRLRIKRPELNKLLYIKPKFGIDVSIDFIDVNHFLELFHIEKDFPCRDSALEAKARIEKLVTETDWEHFANYLLNHKSDWVELCSDDESDYKAQLLGVNRAFENIKVYYGG